MVPRTGELRDIQAVVFSQNSPKQSKRSAYLRMVLRRVTLLGQVAQITDEVLPERGARESLRRFWETKIASRAWRCPEDKRVG